MKQGISLLLVLLFSFLSVVQLIHVHQEMGKGSAGQSSQQEQLQLSDKCSVCDYFHHIQVKQLFSGAQLCLAEIYPIVITASSQLNTAKYKITVQGFSNKGPPYIS